MKATVSHTFDRTDNKEVGLLLLQGCWLSPSFGLGVTVIIHAGILYISSGQQCGLLHPNPDFTLKVENMARFTSVSLLLFFLV